MAKSKELRKLTAEVMAELKAQCARDEEVHHIWGRVGRLAACRLFCMPLTRPLGAANHHGHPQSVLNEFRDATRDEYNEFTLVNKQNREQHVCWYRCVFAKTCKLYEVAP